MATYAPPNAVAAVASGINGKGDICGYMTNTNGVVLSWFYKDGYYTEYVYPGAISTTAFALNWQDQIVGSYIDAAGATHGFILSFPRTIHATWQSIDFPGATSSEVRSINDHVDVVGSYVDAAGSTHGFLAVPATPSPSPTP